jgi:hypothetical protein
MSNKTKNIINNNDIMLRRELLSSQVKLHLLQRKVLTGGVIGIPNSTRPLPVLLSSGSRREILSDEH